MAINTGVSFLTFVIEEVGIFAVGATVVGWVAKGLISQYFDKELSKYQSEIDKELNRYQTELEKDKLRFSELHTERAEITAELYERFVEFEENMRSLMDQSRDELRKNEKRNRVAESGDKFNNFYMKNKIYFPPHICDTIEEIHKEMSREFTTIRRYNRYSDRILSSHEAEQLDESWKKVTQDEVPKLKSDLEDHFRELLGVEVEYDNDTLQDTETEAASETETAEE